MITQKIRFSRYKQENMPNHRFCCTSRAQRKSKKQIEKIDKYLNLARELRKLWNVKVTVVPVVI